MSDLSVLNTVHNFYMTTYAPKTNSPYDTHKKSELRGVYNSIVKLNKESPLYILDNSKETQAYAVGVKENARSLKNTIASIRGRGGLEDEDLLNKKAAYSSNKNIATATFVGNPDAETVPPDIELEVDALASPQVNMGKYLKDDEPVALPPDTYSFDIGINDLSYEFQFKIREGDENKDVQERLARLINNANIGLHAEVKPHETNSNYSYLRLESDTTGLKDGSPTQFTLSEEHTSKTAGAIEYFGIDYMSHGATNASFRVDGTEHTTSGNTFMLGKMYEITLHGVSGEDSPTKIGLKTDVESLQENLSTLVRGYNNFLRAAAEYKDRYPGSGRLMREVSSIPRLYAEGLINAGVNLNLDGSLEIDENAFKASATGADASKNLGVLKDFTQNLLKKSDQVSLNPMNYANKTIVAYKNPGKNFASPYITSAYSGMLFNSYC